MEALVVERERRQHSHRGRSMKIKESDLVLTSLAGTRSTVEKPDKRTLSEWIEFGYKLRSASDEEILSLIGSVTMYLKDKLRGETFSSGECSESLTHYPEKNPFLSHTRKMPPGLVGSTTTPTNLQLCLAPLFIDSCTVSCEDPAVPLSSWTCSA